jgi:histidinol-phosphatase (PHP family)
MCAVQRVSVHGGHSGEFCCHAKDSLSQIVATYIEKKFDWVGITEHMPPVDDQFCYPEEARAGFNARRLFERFERYFATCRRLKNRYAHALQIYVGFETEAYGGSPVFIAELVRKFKPDYIVGSVHHVDDIGFDYSQNLYGRAVSAAGGLEALYCRYFDAQHQFLSTVRPQVVGHFDLIRIFDPSYAATLALPSVRRRLRRNLKLMRSLNMVMDVNCRAMAKGAAEPYPTRPILQQAIDMGIAVVPGDDSHGVDSVGLYFDKVVEVLRELGADLNWRRPAER